MKKVIFWALFAAIIIVPSLLIERLETQVIASQAFMSNGLYPVS